MLSILRRTRIGVLVALAVAALSMLTLPPGAEGAQQHAGTLLGVALAVASILARHLSSLESLGVGGAVACALASLLLALAIGGLGLWIGLAHAARESGILFCFGGFILATPQPRPAALAPHN